MMDSEQNKILSDEILESLQDPTKTDLLTLLDQQKVANEEQDRKLKKKYAHWFIWILITQLVVMNLVFISVGLRSLNFNNISLNLYTTGTLAEVFGIVLVITKNLFPAKKC